MLTLPRARGTLNAWCQELLLAHVHEARKEKQPARTRKGKKARVDEVEPACRVIYAKESEIQGVLPRHTCKRIPLHIIL